MPFTSKGNKRPPNYKPFLDFMGKVQKLVQYADDSGKMKVFQ